MASCGLVGEEEVDQTLLSHCQVKPLDPYSHEPELILRICEYSSAHNVQFVACFSTKIFCLFFVLTNLWPLQFCSCEVDERANEAQPPAKRLKHKSPLHPFLAFYFKQEFVESNTPTSVAELCDSLEQATKYAVSEKTMLNWFLEDEQKKVYKREGNSDKFFLSKKPTFFAQNPPTLPPPQTIPASPAPFSPPKPAKSFPLPMPQESWTGCST